MQVGVSHRGVFKKISKAEWTLILTLVVRSRFKYYPTDYKAKRFKNVSCQDQRGADKLTEWSHRMDVIRLQDMKLQRQVVRQGEQIKYVESLNTQHERTISSLEEDIVLMLKVHPLLSMFTIVTN